MNVLIDQCNLSTAIMTVTTIGFFFLIFFHLQPCLLLLWDFSEWHQHKDLCYFNTIWKSLQAKEFFCGSDGKEENWVRSLNQKDPLEKEMAPHSSILAWEAPWTEEPGGLPSVGLQRVEHSWATNRHPWLCCSQTVWVGIRFSASLLLVVPICNFGRRLTSPDWPEDEMAG